MEEWAKSKEQKKYKVKPLRLFSVSHQTVVSTESRDVYMVVLVLLISHEVDIVFVRETWTYFLALLVRHYN